MIIETAFANGILMWGVSLLAISFIVGVYAPSATIRRKLGNVEKFTESTIITSFQPKVPLRYNYGFDNRPMTVDAAFAVNYGFDNRPMFVDAAFAVK